jgi:hypothetical protein
MRQGAGVYGVAATTPDLMSGKNLITPVVNNQY